MAKDPAFLFYSKDWLSGTAEYMPDEKGVYIDLLCHQHQKGDLPQDTERLARMVGLSHSDFLRIWSVISVHFDQMDNRLVNRRLNQITTERQDRAKINTVNGTFAGLLRSGNFASKIYKHLKDNFVASEFMKYEKSELSKRLTEWITERLKSIGDGNGNEDVIRNNYKGVLQKILAENQITLPDGYEELIIEWLSYKSEKGQSYKERGLKSLIKSFLVDSDGSIQIAREMLDYSMSMNYSGLFRKNSGKSKKQKYEFTDEDFKD